MEEKKPKIDWKDPEQRKAYQRAKNKEYYARDKQKILDRAKAWHKEHPETLTKNMRNYYEKNREAHLKKMAEYHAKNRDKLREQARQRYLKRKLEKQQQSVDNEGNQ